MTDKTRTFIKRFVELRDNSYLKDAGSGGEGSFGSQLIDRRMTLSDIDRRINAIVAPLS